MRTALLIAVASLLTASVMAAEPEAITLGRFTKTGDVLSLADSKVTQAPDKERNPIALIQYGMKDKQIVAYDNLEGGVLAFVGKTEVVFADASSLDDLRKMPADKWAQAFTEFKPMTSPKAKAYHAENPDKPLPRNAVAWTPTVQLMPLVKRPSNFVACKTGGKMYLFEIVEHAEKGPMAKVKVHPLP